MVQVLGVKSREVFIPQTVNLCFQSQNSTLLPIATTKKQTHQNGAMAGLHMVPSWLVGRYGNLRLESPQ